MNNKNKQNKKNNNFPYLNEEKKFKEEIKIMKKDLKKMIDEMPDEEFLYFSFSLFELADDLEADLMEDEGWEDEAEKFYNEKNNNINNFPIENNDLPF